MPNSSKFVTKELDTHTFQAGIFMSNANLFSPVAVYSANNKCQTLEEVFEEIERHADQWATYAGVAGVAQYSLKRDEPAGVLARFDIYFRLPTEVEMYIDFQNFGDQVIGPPVEEVPEESRKKYKHSAIFNPWGKKYYFAGPPRLVKSVFLSRVFSGPLPEDISSLLEEVDVVAETGETIISQGYQFFHATKGNLKYLPFAKKEDYDVSKLKPHGCVCISGDNKMFYFPDADSEPVDFTVTMHD